MGFPPSTKESHLGKEDEEEQVKSKKQTFSKVTAVKANARARVGTPPPERVLPDPKQKAAAKPDTKRLWPTSSTSTGEET